MTETLLYNSIAKKLTRVVDPSNAVTFKTARLRAIGIPGAAPLPQRPVVPNANNLDGRVTLFPLTPRFVVMTKVERPWGLCLHLSDQPTSREIARACKILLARPDRTIRIVATRDVRNLVLAQLTADTSAIWYEPAAMDELLFECKTLGIDAMVCLSEKQPVEQLPGLWTRFGTLAAHDCTSSSDSSADAVLQAITEARPHLGISIRQLLASGHEDRVIAYSGGIPRRPWDSVQDIQERLDSQIPNLLDQAYERLKGGEEIAAPRRVNTSEVPRTKRSRWRQRSTDVKYLAHILGLAWSLFYRTKEMKIICLHNPCPDILDAILGVLARSGPFLSFSQVEQQLRGHCPPKPGYIVTLDDGYKQNMALLDVLDRHGCKAMIYVSTAAVDTMRPLWFMNTDKAPGEAKEHLKILDYGGFLKTIDDAGLTAPCPLKGHFGLRSEDLRTLLSRGHQIGIHTHNHPFLNRLSKDEIRFEIAECHARLRHATGGDSLPLHVSYPDGAHDDQVVRTLEGLGTRTAATINAGPVRLTTNPLRIPRYILSDSDYPGVALLKQTAIYWKLKGLMQSRTKRSRSRTTKWRTALSVEVSPIDRTAGIQNTLAPQSRSRQER